MSLEANGSFFRAAANDAARRLVLNVNKNHFPYWTKPLGMNDAIMATFCSIDWENSRLNIATENVPFTGGAAAGWSLIIDSTKTVPFNFLKKVNTENGIAYVAISYMAAS